MITSILNFPAAATGPSRLRAELRVKTKPLRMLLTASEAMRAVQTAVPQSVLGGNIFALLSGRLQQLLQYPEQPERRMEFAHRHRERFADHPDIGTVAEKAIFSLPPASAQETANRFAPWQSERQNQEPVFPTSAASDVVAETEPFDAALFSNVPASVWEPETAAPHNDHLAIFGKDDVAAQSQRSIQPAASIWAEKLREHWELSQPEFLSERRSNQSLSDGIIIQNQKGSPPAIPMIVEKLQEYWELSQQGPVAERSSNALLRMENDGKRNLPSFSAAPNSNLTPRSWPGMTGQQIAQKLRAFASGRDVSNHVQQTIHTSLPEKVEIHNVFNLEMKSEKATDSMADLSEKIADILREQALEHGIDVT